MRGRGEIQQPTQHKIRAGIPTNTSNKKYLKQKIRPERERAIGGEGCEWGVGK
jgi:hypothetical protein